MFKGGKKNVEQDISVDKGDYELEAVPKSKRKSFLSITMVWTGFVFVIASMMAGGGLATGLNMREIIVVTILGNIFLTIIAVAMAIISCKTGLTFALITRYSFGNRGSRLASFFVPIVNIGWYTIQSAVYGHLIAQILGLGSLGENIAMVVSALLIGIFALIGIDALTVLGFVAIPNIIFLSLATALKASCIAGGVSKIFSYIPDTAMSMENAFSIVVGTWIFSAATCIADIMRYAKNLKEAALSATLGLVGGNSLLIICGAITAISMGDSDLTNVLLKMGLVIPGIILMTTNIWTTNAANIYSTGLNLSNALNKDKKKVLTVVLVISALLTLTKPYKIDALFSFLDILGNIVLPLPGIIFADYYIIHKGDYKDPKTLKDYDWNIIAWVSWGIAAILVFKIKAGFAPLNGIILGAIIYLILMQIYNIFGKQK